MKLPAASLLGSSWRTRWPRSLQRRDSVPPSAVVQKFDLFTLRTLILTSWLPLTLWAEGGTAADDPFGACERALDNQLSAILEHDQSTVKQRVPVSTNLVQTAAARATNSKETGKNWAFRFAARGFGL